MPLCVSTFSKTRHECEQWDLCRMVAKEAGLCVFQCFVGETFVTKLRKSDFYCTHILCMLHREFICTSKSVRVKNVLISIYKNQTHNISLIERSRVLYRRNSFFALRYHGLRRRSRRIDPFILRTTYCTV